MPLSRHEPVHALPEIKEKINIADMHRSSILELEVQSLLLESMSEKILCLLRYLR